MKTLSEVETSDPDGDQLTTTIQWTVNLIHKQKVDCHLNTDINVEIPYEQMLTTDVHGLQISDSIETVVLPRPEMTSPAIFP